MICGMAVRPYLASMTTDGARGGNLDKPATPGWMRSVASETAARWPGRSWEPGESIVWVGCSRDP